MVRLKRRYLLVHILYPDLFTDSDSSGTGNVTRPPSYLIQFHRPSPDDLTVQLLMRAIKDGVSDLYGDYGAGLIASSLSVKYLSQATSTAIIRCSRDHYRLVWAALSFMTQLPKSSKSATSRACTMQIVRISGTIKKVEEDVIKRARSAIMRAKRECADDGLLAVLGQQGNSEEGDTAGAEQDDLDNRSGMSNEDEAGIDLGSDDDH